MLKILHTSDLHIGKRLYQAELYEEQNLFFQWLVDCIRQNQVNVLLVSGDVFDVANPSSESRRIYFELLRELMILKCKVVIAGGNHDSPAVLEAPRELLKHLDIYVTGSLPDDYSSMLVPVKNKAGETEVVVACVPFLRDADLRRYNQDENYEERTEAIRKGIVKVFQLTAEECKTHFPGVPALAMGHLFVQGGFVSESEREIQVGNLAGLEVKNLPDYFSYYALGHLHKPQEPGEKFIYSGSPVQLSFSESGNANRVMLITTDQQSLSFESIPVPLNRKLVRIEGTVEEIRQILRTYSSEGRRLPDLIELIALEEKHDPAKLMDLETVIEDFKHENATILKYRIRFANAALGSASLYDESQRISEMKAEDVFVKRLDREELPEPTRDMLLDAFREILDEVEQTREEE
ncbi:MAG: exonuclease subunit SbcD [Bacteroidetes bacterium]|nr:MAG: exonuclease subunit SbcD [Bacteroidota bacterium]